MFTEEFESICAALDIRPVEERDNRNRLVESERHPNICLLSLPLASRGTRVWLGGRHSRLLAGIERAYVIVFPEKPKRIFKRRRVLIVGRWYRFSSLWTFSRFCSF